MSLIGQDQTSFESSYDFSRPTHNFFRLSRNIFQCPFVLQPKFGGPHVRRERCVKRQCLQRTALSSSFRRRMGAVDCSMSDSDTSRPSSPELINPTDDETLEDFVEKGLASAAPVKFGSAPVK